MPKVSIIVPIYNVERYLDRCVQSLLNQTLKDIEIILVDDGSPDNCPDLCNEYARKDSRIKVIHKKNAGLGFVRNSGLDIANGEYIAFVDSDDYVSENMYEQLYNETVAQNFDIVYCGVNAQKRNGKIIREHVTDRIITKDEIITVLGNMIACDVHSKQERSEPMSVWHAIYKTEIIDLDITFDLCPKERFFPKIFFLTYNYYRIVKISVLFPKHYIITAITTHP